MRNGILGCVTLFLASAGLAPGQTPPGAPSATVSPFPAVAAPGGLPRSAFAEDGRGAEGGHAEKGEGHEAHEEEHHEAEEEHHEGEEEHHKPRLWVQAEYLLWRIRNSNLPPLLTTGSAADARPGALGQPGTQVIFGNSSQENEDRSGARFSAGYWLDEEQSFGVEGGYFFLGTRSVGQFASGTGAAGSTLVVGRPFFDALNGRDDASLSIFPGVVGGSVGAYSRSYLQGFEFNGAANILSGCHGRLDALIGFRYLQLDEDVTLLEDTRTLATAPLLPNNSIQTYDSFGARNWFYGGQVGARASVNWRHWDVTVVTKVALGNTHEVLDVGGATAITPTGGPRSVTSGGLLAQATNSGRFSRDTFSVVPEVGVNVGYRIFECLRAYVGYTFIYWSDVARPGDQIDRRVNPAALPTSLFAGIAGGPARPAPIFNDTGFWAQGVNFGLEFRY